MSALRTIAGGLLLAALIVACYMLPWLIFAHA